MGLLDNRTAIVTGSSSGIGRAIALRFAAEGAVVALADRQADPVEGGEPTLHAIHRAGGRAFFVPTDVANWDDIDALVAAMVTREGRLDVMVNNAATFTGTSLLDTTEAQWAQVAAVNTTGLFFGCKRAVAQMLTQEIRDEVRGRIVNITSQHGMVASPGDPAYGVSKAAAAQLTRQVAVDYAKDHIVCNAVAPGKIVTGKPGPDQDEARLDTARRRTPWPRLGRPEDVASSALYLASDLARFVTGINLLVDGGWMAA